MKHTKVIVQRNIFIAFANSFTFSTKEKSLMMPAILLMSSAKIRSSDAKLTSYEHNHEQTLKAQNFLMDNEIQLPGRQRVIQ